MIQFERVKIPNSCWVDEFERFPVDSRCDVISSGEILPIRLFMPVLALTKLWRTPIETRKMESMFWDACETQKRPSENL